MRVAQSISIAALNAPDRTVISGPLAEIDAIAAEVGSRGVDVRRLDDFSHAFHSWMLDSILDEFEAFAGGFAWHTPRIPVVANLYGTIDDAPSVATCGVTRGD